MLGVTIGLLVALVRQPAPVPESTAAKVVPSTLSYAMPPRLAALPTAVSVNVEGGELIVVIATASPTEAPTATPGVVPTSTPLLPRCGSAAAGQLCVWPMPTLAPTPIPICETPDPGGVCLWPTAIGRGPTSVPMPSPP